MPGPSAPDVAAMNYRELQEMAKAMGRTDSGNHQLVPSNVKRDALRANLERALADRSNSNQPPASPSNAKPAAPVRKVGRVSVAALGAQLQLKPMAMMGMMGGFPRPVGAMVQRRLPRLPSRLASSSTLRWRGPDARFVARSPSDVERAWQ